MEILLTIKNIEKHFNGILALHDLSMDFKKGTVTGVIGPNGSGKTTLMNILSGIAASDRGSFLFDECFAIGKIKLGEASFYKIARTFQNIRLFNQMSVFDNVLVALSGKSVLDAILSKHGKFYRKKAEKILKKIGLWEKKNELAAKLSYGQQKLLEIARVIAQDARIILLDEPFAGLFPETIEKVKIIINELKKEGKSVILVEHNIDVIANICDYVYVLDGGRILAKGKPEETLKKKEIREIYLGK